MDNFKDKLRNFYRRSPVTFGFLLLMLVYYIFLTIKGGSTNSQTLLEYGALFPPYIKEYGQYYRFISSIFIHIGLSHLIFNGYALYIFGQLLERLMGWKKYLAFFLLTGVAGNLLTYIFNFASLSAGASGSIFGIFGAFLYIIRKYPDRVSQAARKDILSLIGFNLLLTFLVPSISITAHLGGFIVGYFSSYIFIN